MRITLRFLQDLTRIFKRYNYNLNCKVFSNKFRLKINLRTNPNLKVLTSNINVTFKGQRNFYPLHK